MVSAAAAALVNIVLNYLLIPRYGLLGCAWATTAAYGVNVLVLITLVDWKFLPTRTWTLQATLPAVLGAGAASWSGQHSIGLGLTLIATISLALIHRRSLGKGMTMLNNLGRMGFTKTTASL